MSASDADMPAADDDGEDDDDKKEDAGGAKEEVELGVGPWRLERWIAPNVRLPIRLYYISFTR